MTDTEPHHSRQNSETKQQDAFDFVSWGPPPSLKQRALIFDSLQKIVTAKPAKHRHSHGDNNRGTYVFTWGAGYHGQLGRKFVRGQKKYSAIPLMVNMDVVIRQVVCGGLHTAVVTENGTVYTWGDGRKGELGHAHDPSVKQTPLPVEALENVFITQVACGGSHTVAISDSGQLYSWGWARYGQTGHGDRQVLKIPKKLDHPLARDIVQVACGNKHTVAVTRAGRVLSWGCGEHGQTGHGDNVDRLIPTRIESLVNHKIVNTACGAIHTCLLTDEGHVYLCGFGEYFDRNEDQHFFYDPKHIPMPEPIKQVACGQSHNVALAGSGNVYAWGSGEYGQIGYGIKGNTNVPRLVLENKHVAQVAAGRYHSFALTSTGVLYSWGCGENGQLGVNSDENVTLPTVVAPILGTVVGQIACGEHHTAVLTSAPWSKLSHDMQEWHYAAKFEHELTQRYLSRTHRGLTRKDLSKIKEEMRRWHVMNEKRQAEARAEEGEETKRDIEAIMYKKELTAIVRDELSSNDHAQTLVLPSVGGQPQDQDTDGRAQTQPAPGLRLPAVQARKNGMHTSSKKALPRSRQAGGLPVVRRGMTPAGEPRAMEDTQSLSTTFARTSFLKETAQMVRRMTAVVQDKGEANTNKELQKMLRLVFDYRKDYDALRDISRKKTKILNDYKRELKLLNQTAMVAEQSTEQCNVRLKALEMQLNTVQIKIAETGENRKNYELNIAHLKEEDFEHFNELKALRKANNDNNAFFKKLNESRIQAVEDKEKAESELGDFRQEIQAYQKFVQGQLAQFESVLEIVRNQNEKRENAKSVRADKHQAKIAQRISRLNAEAEAADKEAGGLTARLTSLDLKLRHFEDSFQKITAATGLSNPDAIVNKFFFKGEIKDQLRAEIDDKQNTIAALRESMSKLDAELKGAKEGFKDQTWRDVEGMSEQFRESSFVSGKTMKQMEEVLQRLAFVQEGLVALLRTVEATNGKTVENDELLDREHSDVWNLEQADQIFGRTEGGLDELLMGAAERELIRQRTETAADAAKTVLMPQTFAAMDEIDTTQEPAPDEASGGEEEGEQTTQPQQEQEQTPQPQPMAV